MYCPLSNDSPAPFSRRGPHHRENKMKGYWIAHVTVTDPQAYQAYTELAPEILKSFGAKLLARGGNSRVLEGQPGRDRHVVIEFPSYQDALNCYHSEAYQHAITYRADAALAQVVIVEGI